MVYKSSSSHVFDGQAYTVKYRFQQHTRSDGIFCFSHALLPSNAPPKSSPVASAAGYVILRDYLGGSRQWYAQMFTPSRATAELSSLFDACGRILPEHISSLYTRGSGVWSHELSAGSLLMVTELTVIESHRRDDIATGLLAHVLSEPDISRPPPTAWRITHPPPSKCEFAIAWPCGLNGQNASDERQRERTDIAVRTFQSVGFRRIGRSGFLAKPLRDVSHPALRLPAQDDASELSQPILSRPLPVVSPFMRTLIQAGWPDNSQRLPLHAMITSPNCSDNDILRALERLSSPVELAHLCIPDPTAMNATPLHLAATRRRATVIEKLLTTNARSNLFTSTAHGRLPLDCLQRTMREERAAVSTLGMQEWSGHSALAIRSQAILLSAMGRPVPSEDAARWGCTCGKCSLGWLSPSMAYQINVHSHTAATSMQLSLASTPADETRGRDRLYRSSTLNNIHFMNYIPTSVREPSLPATFIEGYAAVLRAISFIATNKMIPSVEAVSRHVLDKSDGRSPTFVAEFFRQGGKVEHALNGVLHAAREQGPGGERIFLEVDGYADELRALPSCDNDEDYGLIRANLKIPVNMNGPLSSGWWDPTLTISSSPGDSGSASSSDSEM